MSEKRKRIVLCIDDKLKIIKRLDDGEHPSKLAKEYGIGVTTVRDLKKKEKDLSTFASNLDNSGASLALKTIKTLKKTNIDVSKFFRDSNSSEDDSKDVQLNQADDATNNLVCRTCLSRDELKSIYDKTVYFMENAKMPLYKILMECAAVKVDEDDNLPTKICKNCIDNLKHAYAFKRQCENTDAILRLRVNGEDSSNEATIIKIEPQLDFYKVENEGGDYENASLFQNDDSERNTDTGFECDDIKMEDSNMKDFGNDDYYESDSDNDDSKYDCNKCKKKYNSKSELDKHVAFEHGKTKKGDVKTKSIGSKHKKKGASCPTCGKNFANARNLKFHNLIHSGEFPHVCPICKRAFRVIETLKYHLKIHSGETPFICNHCGKSFRGSSALSFHIRQKHTENSEENRPHICPVCNQSYPSKKSLTDHLPRHKERKFLCSECGRRFVNKRDLKIHTRVHTGYKPYKCTSCNKAFAQWSGLKAHSYLHTGEKHYKCKLCDRTFTLRHHLAYHMQTHTGERPFMCTVCGKSFPYETSLNVHRRTHTGEAPYSCPICGNGFKTSNEMKKHKQIHDDNPV